MLTDFIIYYFFLTTLKSKKRKGNMARGEGFKRNKRSNMARGETSYTSHALSMAKPCTEGLLFVGRQAANEGKLLVARRRGPAC